MSQASILRSPAATISSLSSSGSEDSPGVYDVFSYLPPGSKVIAAAPTRIYHSAFNTDPDAWTPTGLRGTLVFGRSRSSASRDNALGPGEVTNAEHDYWFRLVDVDSGKGIVWFHQIPVSFDYRADKPFFHVFSGCSRMFGFRFDEDADAERFVKCVISRVQITGASSFSRNPGFMNLLLPHSPTPPSFAATRSTAKPRTPKFKSKPKSKLSRSSASILTTSTSSPSLSPSRSPSSARRHVSPSMISSPSPDTFVHVAHIGVDHSGRIEASPNVEPDWTHVLEEMQGFGADVTNAGAVPIDANLNMDPHGRGSVEGFFADAEIKPRTPQPPPPPTTTTGSASAASSESACSTSMRSRRESGAHWAGCVSSSPPGPGVAGGLKNRFISRRRAPGPEA
ncbi:hypothetical protein C8Q79DRAFT_1012388 [Trametes meyenii]|nr:hypothetical protein C8Q79DRAFT_1012388 [Trametes meyenii]